MPDITPRRTSSNGQAFAELACIAAVFALCDQALSKQDCSERAQLLLTVGGGIDSHGKGSVQFVVEGNMGQQEFSFASGTTCLNVIDAINSFADETGVSADGNSYAFLQSVTAGSNAFVSVKQVGGAFPYVCVNFAEPCGVCDYQGIDFGIDKAIPGDLNCSGHVNQWDLSWLLYYWTHPCGMPCAGDCNGDGVVNIDDLVVLINHWDSNCD